MEIIPVVDLKDARAVGASRGERDRYRPLSCPLCRGGDPLELVTAYLQVYPFRTLYVADVDAIRGHADNDSVIRRIRHSWPTLNLWIAAGLHGTRDAALQSVSGLGTPVFGTESLRTWDAFAPTWERSNSVLSLDYRTGRLIGPPQIWHHPQSWPSRIIVMTLNRIGSGTGPDFPLLERVLAHSHATRVYAAGGVRDPADLARLAAIGVSGALVATALHDGRLDGGTIAEPHKFIKS